MKIRIDNDFIKGVFYYDELKNIYIKKGAEFKFDKVNNKGLYLEKSTSGRIKKEVPFINQDGYFLKDGIEKIYYPRNYNLYEENSFKKGWLNGIQKRYFTDGKLESETFYEMSETAEGIRTNQRYYKFYYYTGELKEEVYSEYGRKYYDTGELISEWKSKDFTKIGSYLEKYPSGQIKLVVEYVDGFRDGDMQKYYENGKLKEIWTYQMGEIKFIKKFFPNGNIKSEWWYNGVALLRKTEYDSSGAQK